MRVFGVVDVRSRFAGCLVGIGSLRGYFLVVVLLRRMWEQQM